MQPQGHVQVRIERGISGIVFYFLPLHLSPGSILYFPSFYRAVTSKIAAKRIKSSNSTNKRESMGVWTVYAPSDVNS